MEKKIGKERRTRGEAGGYVIKHAGVEIGMDDPVCGRVIPRGDENGVPLRDCYSNKIDRILSNVRLDLTCQR